MMSYLTGVEERDDVTFMYPTALHGPMIPFLPSQITINRNAVTIYISITPLFTCSLYIKIFVINVYKCLNEFVSLSILIYHLYVSFCNGK